MGDYKKLPNEVGGMETVLPEEVSDKMKALDKYKVYLDYFGIAYE